MQTADTLGRGNFQVGVETGVLSAASSSAPIGDGNPSWIPHVDVSARFGVSEGVDLGLRAGLSFLELQGKFLFTKPGERVAVSFAPTAGGLLLGGSGSSASSIVGLLNVGLPVLIGFKTSGGSEFVIGPRVQNLVLLAGTSTVYGVGVGGSIGFAIRFTENFGLMPEASIVVPVAGAAAFASQFQSASVLGTGLFFFQFKIGVLVGKFRPAPNAKPVEPPPSTIPPPGQVPISNQPLPEGT
ncbi:MAG: hypothetical protein QM817_41620 [Archangium sp.]